MKAANSPKELAIYEHNTRVNTRAFPESQVFGPNSWALTVDLAKDSLPA